MKTARRRFGDWGEQVAAEYLVRHDYALLARNWTVGHLEIDLIAEWFGELIFIEVKTRRSEAFERAVDAVDAEKQRNIIEAAAAYRMERGLTEMPYRFDIITVVGDENNYSVEHLKRAYEYRNRH